MLTSSTHQRKERIVRAHRVSSQACAAAVHRSLRAGEPPCYRDRRPFAPRSLASSLLGSSVAITNVELTPATTASKPRLIAWPGSSVWQRRRRCRADSGVACIASLPCALRDGLCGTLSSNPSSQPTAAARTESVACILLGGQCGEDRTDLQGDQTLHARTRPPLTRSGLSRPVQCVRVRSLVFPFIFVTFTENGYS